MIKKKRKAVKRKVVKKKTKKPFGGYAISFKNRKETLEQVRRMVGKRVKQVFVDRGYRGHGYEGKIEVHVDKQRKGKTAKRLWKWMKRRAVVEPGISHLKHGHRMNRNRLKGTQGDQLNAVLSAAGMNFRKLHRACSCSSFGNSHQRLQTSFKPSALVCGCGAGALASTAFLGTGGSSRLMWLRSLRRRSGGTILIPISRHTSLQG